MAVTIELPGEIEQNLRREFGDLDQVAKEALLVELYRRDMLTRYELSLALGLDRFEADALLKKHNVTEDLPTAEELAEDIQRLSRLTSE
jgi:hypothetical protein